MSNENAQNGQNGQNGAGAQKASISNGHGDPPKAQSSSKKKKHRGQPPASHVSPAPAVAAPPLTAAPATPDAPVTVAPATPDAPVAPSETIASSSAAPDPAPPAVEISEPGPIPSSVGAPTIEGLRLRMKVWTDPVTSRRYLMPTAFMRDIVNGRPVTDVMYAYAMRDDETKLITLRASEWNTLPFYYFEEDGPAPRATERRPDVIG